MLGAKLKLLSTGWTFGQNSHSLPTEKEDIFISFKKKTVPKGTDIFKRAYPLKIGHLVTIGVLSISARFHTLFNTAATQRCTELYSALSQP